MKVENLARRLKWYMVHYTRFFFPKRQSTSVVIGGRATPSGGVSEQSLPGGLSHRCLRKSLGDLSWEELPRSEPYLVVIECGESPRLLVAKVAQLRQRNPRARVALLGYHWGSADIAMAFEAGASAYFAEATIKEFLQTIKWITR